MLSALAALTMSAHAAIQIKWTATANETKTLYAITGNGFSINWGDGTTDSNSSHTYASAGNYTVLISGTVSSLDLRGDATNPTGISGFALTEADKTLNTLYLWGNTNLKSIDVTKAIGLQQINTTADPISSLDLSQNTSLTAIDLKLCSSLTTLSVASSYNSLTTADVNNSALTACSLNALFTALPTGSGSIYTVGCTGDATSDPSIATKKGWTFGNGGTGNGSAVCQEPLTAPSGVQSAKINGSDNYLIDWNGSKGADSYSVKLVAINGGDECSSTFAFTSDTTSSLTIPVSDPSKFQYYVYSVNGTSFEKAGPFNFSTTSVTTIDNNAITAVYSYGDRIVAHNVKAGETVKLYNVNGILLGIKKSTGSDVTFSAAVTGTYLVGIGNKSYKIVTLLP